MKLKKLKLRETTIHILPVIKGLVSEADKVREAFEKIQPDVVAVSLSREELDGLRSMPDNYEPELSRYEEIYAQGLSKFGEVAAPPPCYVAILELADHLGVSIVPVDLDEASYTELYCAAVSGTTLFRHSTRTWLLKRKNFRAKSPEEFVVAWDRVVNKLEGFETVERKRAESIAQGILKAADGSTNLLALVEYERADDVAQLLSEKVS